METDEERRRWAGVRGAHRRIAEREEVAWDARAAEIATELAHHYTQTGQIEQALRYVRLAAEQAVEGETYPETATLIGAAFKLLEKLHEDTQLGMNSLDWTDIRGETVPGRRWASLLGLKTRLELTFANYSVL